MNVFETAAALLEGEALAPQRQDDAKRLLARLGSGAAQASGCSPIEGARTGAHAIRVLRAAARMSRIFELGAPDAPGLAFVGGTADPTAYGLPTGRFQPANVSGRGLTAGGAFLGCVGEAIEYLSQLEWGDEILEGDPGRSALEMTEATVAAFMTQLQPMDDPVRSRWIAARSLTRNKATRVPAALCLRPGGRGQNARPLSLGAGCAAGETAAEATLSALLELVERDAAALWWIGGRRPRPLRAEVEGAPLAILRTLGQGVRSRRTSLLDISTDVGVPCIAAVSSNDAGLGFACGLAARTSLEAAAQAALLELCQMELANALVAFKVQSGGDKALAPIEAPRKRRMEEITADACDLVSAKGCPAPLGAAVPETVGGQIDWIVRRLEKLEIECFAVDLTRPAIGVPVIRTLAPALESLPQGVPTARLARAIANYGGGPPHTQGIDLL